VIRALKQRLIDRLGISRVAASADAATATAETLQAELDATRAELDILRAAVDDTVADSRPIELWGLVERGTAWAAAAPLRATPLISIVMPTRNRPEALRAAVQSVVAQSYPRWELVVVDDGSATATSDVMAEMADGDRRIRRERTEGVGAAAARNRGLASATGAWVAFLDDDNLMHPSWLRGVAEYVGRYPACRAIHGAQLRDDGPGAAPWLLFDPPPDLEALRIQNTIDLGMLAVRRDHPQLHFDEALDLYIDWELVVRIQTSEPIHPVPVLSGFYSAAAGDRISDRHDERRLAALPRRLAP
jgi:glycosyltransferase involved in cell wall biosynthesis